MALDVINPLHVYIGYDPRQPVAFQTLAHSIWDHASSPVSITRLALKALPLTRTGLTQFTYSRFLVPWLSQYEGTSVFLDSDCLCRGDIMELLAYAMAYPDADVLVSRNKLRFEWASVMVFNNARCRVLTPDYVQDPAHSLFDFAWAAKVGDLPPAWNHLVGYDAPNPDAKIVHYTQGIPCWKETTDCEHATEWKQTVQRTMSTVSFQDLMGRSVHVAAMQKKKVLA